MDMRFKNNLKIFEKSVDIYTQRCIIYIEGKEKEIHNKNNEEEIRMKKHIVVVEKVERSNGDEIGSCVELSKYESKRLLESQLEKIKNGKMKIVFESDDYKEATEWQVAHSAIREKYYGSGDSKFEYVAYVPEGGQKL